MSGSRVAPPAYPEWPTGLGDPHIHTPFGALGATTASAKGRRELVAAFRARNEAVTTTKEKAKVFARDFEDVKFPPRKCSFQVRCRFGVATKKCQNCVKYDEFKLGYYCDACFDARHPAYRLDHSWISIQNDVNQEQEWVSHVARLKFEQDTQELKLLLAETQSFLHRPRTSSASAVLPPSTRPPPSSHAMSHMTSYVVVPPSPPKPPSIQRTAAGDIDFHSTYAAMASIQDTLRRLTEQMRSEVERRAPMTRAEALVKIQRMWKIRCARKQLKALVRSVYASFEDPATGETYYYNTKTNTTQWTKPKALGTGEDILPAHANTTVQVQSSTKHDKPRRVFSSRQEQEADAAVHIQGMLRAHTARARMRKLISSVYEKIWDASSERFYYHNTHTKQVKWEKPRWVNDADLLTPRARQQQADDEKKRKKVAAMRAVITEDGAATMLQRAYRRKKGFEALLQLCRQVYERIFDPSQNAFYYHNTRTKETTWEKPALLRNANADVLSPRSRLKHLETAAATALASCSATRSGSLSKSSVSLSRGWTEESAAVCLQGLYRTRRANRELNARLARVYKRVLDEDSGCFYYVDLRTSAVSWDPPALLQESADAVVCGVDEIQLASDGAIDHHSLQLGERVTPNHTLSGAVSEGEYHFYHLCILRHEHEHQINVNLTVERAARTSGRWRSVEQPDANLYMSSEELHPRVGHSTWIAQRVGDDFVKLYTYLDGFPRKSESRSIPLHIGVRGVSSERAHYNLTVSVLNLPRSQDVAARERFYSKQHQLDRERFGGAVATAVAQQRSRRLRSGGSE